jgi:hypothetical protein
MPFLESQDALTQKTTQSKEQRCPFVKCPTRRFAKGGTDQGCIYKRKWVGTSAGLVHQTAKSHVLSDENCMRQ